jgi:hypothetical protein
MGYGTKNGLPTGRLVGLLVLLTALALALLTAFALHVASDALALEAESRVASTAAVGAVAIQRRCWDCARLSSPTPRDPR